MTKREENAQSVLSVTVLKKFMEIDVLTCYCSFDK